MASVIPASAEREQRWRHCKGSFPTGFCGIYSWDTLTEPLADAAMGCHVTLGTHSLKCHAMRAIATMLFATSTKRRCGGLCAGGRLMGLQPTSTKRDTPKSRYASSTREAPAKEAPPCNGELGCCWFFRTTATARHAVLLVSTQSLPGVAPNI